MNNISTHAIAFVLFVRFFVLTKLALYFISIEIYSNLNDILPTLKS